MPSTPHILRNGESIRPLGPMRLLVDGASTDGRLSVYTGSLPIGGPPLHIHDFDEMLLVISGRVLVQLGEEISEAGPGDMVWLAAHHPHTFANPGPEPLEAIGLAMPGGIEDLFAERGAYVSGLPEGTEPDLDRMADIYAAHASRVVGPPIDLS